jgi:hypothetical protein
MMPVSNSPQETSVVATGRLMNGREIFMPARAQSEVAAGLWRLGTDAAGDLDYPAWFLPLSSLGIA